MARQQSGSSRCAPDSAIDPSDFELVRRIRQADEIAFNRLYERYFSRVYGFVHKRLRNHADTEEVVQETFTAVYRSLEGFSGRSSLASWIYGIAKNHANSHIRRAQAEEVRVERAESELVRVAASIDTCTPEEHLNLRRSEAAIRDRLESVDDWHAEAFRMRHFENCSVSEISHRLSRSNDAVRSSLYRTKKLVVDTVDPGFLAVG